MFAAVTDSGEALGEEEARRLLTLPGRTGQPASIPNEVAGALVAIAGDRQGSIQRSISERNGRFFDAEAEKLDGWADDLKVGLEREIKNLDRQIKDARRTAKLAPTLEEKLAGQKQIKALESKRSQMRKELFDAQDAIDARREELITGLEKLLQQRTDSRPLFQLRWNVR